MQYHLSNINYEKETIITSAMDLFTARSNDDDKRIIETEAILIKDIDRPQANRESNLKHCIKN